MSTPNPIDSILKTGPHPGTRPPPNPIDVLLQQLPQHNLIERPRSGGEIFREGFGAGLLHPIQSVTGTEAGTTEGMTGGQAATKITGELIGMGISFIPFMKGAQLGLRGVGLAARLSPWALRLAEGALAAGAYEAGSGPLSEAPQRVATGAAFGLAMEAGFMGAASLWRARFPKTSNLGAVSGFPEGVSSVVDVHPDALRVEQYLRPTVGEPAESIARIRGVGDTSKQMEFVAAEVARTYHPGGLAIIPGIERPQEMISFFKQQMPDVTFAFRPTEGGLFEVMMADAKAQTRLRTVASVPIQGDRKLSFQQAIDLIMTDTPHEPAIPVVLSPEAQLKKDYGPLGFEFQRLYGFIKHAPSEIHVADDTGFHFETLVHEYGHSLTQRLTTRGTVDIRELFVRELGQQNFMSFPSPEDVTRQVRKELREATIEVVKKVNPRLASGTAAVKAVDGNAKYFLSDSELMSRMLELMFIDPALARRVAPRATELTAQLIREESPKMQMLLGRQELKNIDDVMTDLWVKRGDRTYFLREEPFEINAQMRQQFTKHGVFEGMEVLHNGKSYEVAQIADDGATVRLRNIGTGGFVGKVPIEAVHRPLFPNVVSRNVVLEAKVRALFESPPAWVGTILNDPASGGVRRAIVNLKSFDRTDNFGTWVRENSVAITKKTSSGTILESSRDRGVMEDLVADVLVSKGKDGLVINDNGRYLLFVARDDALRLSNDVFSPQYTRGPIDGTLSPAGKLEGPGRWIELSQRNLAETLLRVAGVTDRELSHYLRLDPVATVAQRIMEPEVTQSLQTAARGAQIAASGGSTLDDVAASYGVRVETTPSGEIRLSSPEHVELAILPNEAAAKEYITKVGPSELTDLEVGATTPTDFVNASGGPSQPPRPQAQAAPRPFSERLLDSSNLFASMFTAMENWSKSAERAGFGPAFTRIFDPVQKAIQKVDWELARVKRDLLGGRTYNEQLRHIEKLARGMSNTEQTQVLQYVEYMSKEEIAREGGLLQRAMTPEEIKISAEIERLGMQHDIPRLVATDQLLTSFIKDKDEFLVKAAKLVQTDPSPELAASIQALKDFADANPTREALMDFLGLSQEERFILQTIEGGRGTDADTISIFAVSRHASARLLDPKFSSGRAQFAAEQGMNGRQLKLAEELDKTYEAAFASSTSNARSQIGGFWPHMRKFAEYGFTPEADFIKQHLPEATEWSARGFKSGELDVYSMDPVMTTFKQVRSSLMRQEFDPIMKDVTGALKVVKATDQRTYRIMSEYVQEVMGKPHASFETVQNVIKQSAKALGIEVPDNLARDIVNTFTALGYGATIPFRPALIIRNYYSVLQMVAPRTGIRNFFRAARIAMEKEGYEEAARAGAITANVAPVHGTSEIFEFGASKLNRRLQRLLEKGFSWYQHADDLGRAVAFHAQRLVIKDNMEALMAGRMSYEEFKQAARINTFDSIDIARFDDMWRAGHYEEAADMMGNTLARETIFRYGHANHPAGWGSIYGRLFGQFGTWPVQYKDYILQGMTRGSTKDRFQFAATHAAINAASVTAGASLGLNLQSWVSYPSLNYTGGPFAGMALNVVTAIGGSEQERQLARNNLMFQLPTLAHPQSVFIPGSYLLGDLMRMGEADNIVEAAALGSGFKRLKPTDDPSSLEFLLGY